MATLSWSSGFASRRSASPSKLNTSPNQISETATAQRLPTSRLSAHGVACMRSGQLAQGLTLLQQSLAVVRPLNDPAALSDTLLVVGLADFGIGNYAEARDHLREGLTVSRTIQYQWAMAFCLMNLGSVAQACGDYLEAQVCFQDSLRICRAMGSPRTIAACLVVYSALAYELKQHDQAQLMLRESLIISRTTNDRWIIATSLRYLGLLAQVQGDTGYAESRSLLRESVALFREMGESALALLQAPQSPALDLILANLLNELAAFPDDFPLVLDDYHVIENPALHHSLTFLLDHLPPNMHLVITSRIDPALPLSRRRARRQLSGIRAADLRFTPGEAARNDAMAHCSARVHLPTEERVIIE